MLPKVVLLQNGIKKSAEITYGVSAVITREIFGMGIAYSMLFCKCRDELIN